MSEGSPTPGDQVQRIPHNPTSARVPDKIARGVTATAFMAFYGPNEFVIDFMQLITRPAHLVARVVMTPVVAEQFLGVLRENLSRYQASFGTPPGIPRPGAQEKPRPPQEIYDEVKIAEDQMSGVYANTVLVGHTPAEFGIDFITSFIPHASVAARVYVAAPRVQQLIDTLSGLIHQYKTQMAAQQAQQAQQRPPEPPKGYGTAPGVPGFPTPPQG
jgi:hypothetical protein